MRTVRLLALGLSCLAAFPVRTLAAPTADPALQTAVDRFFVEALAHGQAYDNLRTLVSQCPGRLGGSPALDRAVTWSQRVLGGMKLDRVATQDVMLPHWERGARESVRLLSAKGDAVGLAAAALGNSAGTPPGGLKATVVEVHSLAELAALGREKIAGRIVFFNRPMDPAHYRTADAYVEAGDQRNHGPAAAAALGAVAALTRSLTLARDDVPHTGNTTFPPRTAPIPAAALSVLAADRLSSALANNPTLPVEIRINARLLPDAPSHNVVGEIRGTEFPDQIIVVGAHLDSWDIAPGAHDDGAGVVQSIEVLRLFRALGLKPRHTLRCVLFVGEENSLNGAKTYAAIATSTGEKHVLALESDNGGFAPAGFELGNAAGDAHVRAARWRPLLERWGLWSFRPGDGGADVEPLLALGATTGGIKPDSQRYFDYHHSVRDAIEQVNPRELHLGAASLAALIWLVDTQGL